LTLTKKDLAKGELAEEALKAYFVTLGYFVVRSVPFNYSGYDVTDVDLWLYMKSSPLNRDRTCVDIKRKKTPQAIERVFWTKGLREVLGVERAIVVTTDNRKETREFGSKHNVIVLHGEFLQRIINIFSKTTLRIIEEKLIAELKIPCVMDKNVLWPSFYKGAKATLLVGLNFNGCNQLLSKIRLIIEEYMASNKTSVAMVRLLYVVTAYFLIALDYTTRLISHLDLDSRRTGLAEGFRYGDAGRQRTDEIVDTALKLLVDTSSADIFSSAKIKAEVENQLSQYPADVLAEYVAKSETLNQLFTLGRAFEGLAYELKPPMPDQCPAELKTILGLLCDFFKIDRKKVL